MAPRKRRYEQAFSEHESLVPDEKDEALKEKERADKEQEVWDAIRETHYEAIEQLPLTLQRQLSLMRQLDEQTVSYSSRLVPTLQKYIQLRRDLAGIEEEPKESSQPPEGNLVEESTSVPVEHPQPNGVSPTALLTTARRLRSGDINSFVGTPTPGSVPPERPTPAATTKELLTQIAWMSEELLRASQEKINLAQANYDSVERHIHLLDQAINEQKASLSSDSSNSFRLPELVIPQWRRSSQAGLGSLDDEFDVDPDEENTPLIVDEPQASKSRSSRKKDKGDHGNDSTSLTITLPAAQPSEELYCYCNRVSFGEMIACDMQDCEREWFHLGCVGLTEPPEGEWYCEDCRVDDES